MAKRCRTCMVLCFATCSATCSMLRDHSEKRFSYSCAQHAADHGIAASSRLVVVPACTTDDSGGQMGRAEPHLNVMMIVFGVFSRPRGKCAARIGLLGTRSDRSARACW